MSPVALLAGAGAALLAVLAAWILGREAGQADLAARVQQVSRPGTVQAPARSVAGAALGPLRALGEALRRRAVFSPKEVLALENVVAAAGLVPGQVVSAFIGAKVLLLVLAPLAAGGLAWGRGVAAPTLLLAVAGGILLGVMLPNCVVGALRRPYLAALRRGLPDGLDLLVVCAEAGLGLDSAVERVALELQPSNPAVAREFSVLAQELRVLPDRREALEHLGERTGLEGFKRVSATLSQTFRYGTPLAQALRVLAAEMRQERMTRLEERAARLPALLVLPLILFIMPCLFIVLIGPSVIQLMGHFGK